MGTRDPVEELAEAVAGSLDPPPPHVVAVAGPVAVGKSTVAGALGHALTRRGRSVHVVATDAFLYPNAVLDDRGLTLRKGFPESFDLEAIARFLGLVRSGAARIEIPVYSHDVYDIVPGETAVLEGPDLVIVEGVVALQDPIGEGADVGVYVDAAHDDVRRWFGERFVMLTEAARSDSRSFYSAFAAMSEGEVRRIAEATWDGINLPNLREHIAPTRERARIVVEKAGDHSIVRVAAS